MPEINFSLDREPFHQSILAVIHEAEEDGLVIPLPIMQNTGKKFLEQLSLILAQVDCSHCESICCKQNHGIPIAVSENELNRLLKIKEFPHEKITKGWSGIMTPCPFLIRYSFPALAFPNCEAYSIRPSVCVMYPFQIGGSDDGGKLLLSLASECPEAQRIAISIYMTMYDVKKVFSLL